MSEKHEKADAMKKILLMSIMAMGADVYAPKPLRDKKIEELGLEENKTVKKINDILDNVEDTDLRGRIVLSILFSHLLPSQMVNIGDGHIIAQSKKIVDFVTEKENAKYREKISAEDMLGRIFG